jgi:hypothetical protein
VTDLEARCADVLADLHTVLAQDKAQAVGAGLGVAAVLDHLRREFLQA